MGFLSKFRGNKAKKVHNPTDESKSKPLGLTDAERRREQEIRDRQSYLAAENTGKAIYNSGGGRGTYKSDGIEGEGKKYGHNAIGDRNSDFGRYSSNHTDDVRIQGSRRM